MLNFIPFMKQGDQSKNKSKAKPICKRHLTLESLERREMLSVTFEDFSAIREQYAELNLSASANKDNYNEIYNIIEITPSELSTDTALHSAINTAATTPKPDLIVVRTTATQNTITLSSQLSIAINTGTFGSVTIVSYGAEPLTLDANNNSRVISITNSSVAFPTDVALGGIKITGGNSLGKNDWGNDGTTIITGYGGGVFSAGKLTLCDTTIIGNIANVGGGIINYGGTLNVWRSSIVGNMATNTAGGVLCQGISTIVSSLVAKNTAQNGIGDGVYVVLSMAGSQLTSSVLDMVNSTVTANSNEGLRNAAGASTHLTNSIIAGNTGLDINKAGGTVRGYNSLSTFSGWDTNSVNNIEYDNTKPLFANAASGDYRLAIGSQAIDKGDSNHIRVTNKNMNENSLDLAGNPRFAGDAIDMGAYEWCYEVDVKLSYMAPKSGVPVQGEEMTLQAVFERAFELEDIPPGYIFDSATWTIEIKGAVDKNGNSIFVPIETLISDADTYEDGVLSLTWTPEYFGKAIVRGKFVFKHEDGTTFVATWKFSNGKQKLEFAIDQLISNDEIVHMKIWSTHNPYQEDNRAGFNGYYVDKIIDTNTENGFYFVGFAQYEHDDQGKKIVNKPLEVLPVFCDTEALLGWGFFLDAVANSDKRGVGYNQYYSASAQVYTWALNLYNGKGSTESNISLAGFSLGGALAQWFAVDWTGGGRSLKKIDLYQSAGINAERAADFKDAYCGPVNIYVFAGDIVPLSGEFIKGTVHIYYCDDILPTRTHGIYNFSEEAKQATEHLLPAYRAVAKEKDWNTPVLISEPVVSISSDIFNLPYFHYSVWNSSSDPLLQYFPLLPNFFTRIPFALAADKIAFHVTRQQAEDLRMHGWFWKGSLWPFGEFNVWKNEYKMAILKEATAPPPTSAKDLRYPGMWPHPSQELFSMPLAMSASKASEPLYSFVLQSGWGVEFSYFADENDESAPIRGYITPPGSMPIPFIIDEEEVTVQGIASCTLGNISTATPLDLTDTIDYYFVGDEQRVYQWFYADGSPVEVGKINESESNLFAFDLSIAGKSVYCIVTYPHLVGFQMRSDIVEVNSSITTTPLAAPTNITVTDKNAATPTLTITWSAVQNVSGYKIQYATNSDFNQADIVGTQDVAAGITQADSTVALTADIRYYVRVMAIGTGNYTSSPYSTETANAVPTVTTTTTSLPQPANISANSKNATTITISWDAVDNASGYVIQYATDADFTQNVDTQSVSGGMTQTADITGLHANTLYYVRVMATGTGVYGDSDYSAAKSAMTLSLGITPVMQGGILLIEGTDNADWIEIQETATEIIVHCFSANGVTRLEQWSFARNTITTIVFNGYGGDDTFKNAYDGVICSIACRLDGGTGNNTLIGGTGNDWIYGGTGNNILDGGGGNNIVIGGYGNNTFYNNGTGSTAFAWVGSTANNQWAAGNGLGSNDAQLIFSPTWRNGSTNSSYGPLQSWTEAGVIAAMEILHNFYLVIGNYKILGNPGYNGVTYVTMSDTGSGSYNSGGDVFLLRGNFAAIHEFAHSWQSNTYQPFWNDFQSISWTNYSTMKPDAVAADFAGSYAMASAGEDWAQTVQDVVYGWVTGSSNKYQQKLDIVDQFFTWLNQDREAHSTVVTTHLDVIDPTDGLISLREALIYAKPGDTITFDPSMYGKTITLSGEELTIAKNITIDATGMNITIDANQKSRVIYIDEYATVSLVGLTIIGGDATDYDYWWLRYGGGIYNNGTLTATNCVISGNTAEYGGGLENWGTAILISCVISENVGGGIDNYEGTMTLINCAVTGNSDGGIYNDDGFMTVIHCTIAGNSTDDYGGGICNYGTLTISNTIIAGNAAYYGADVYNGTSYGGTISGSYNLIGNGTGQSTLVNGNNGNIVGTSASPINPGFVDLTRGNYRLAAGSPAIDKGSNALIPSGITTDLDRNARIYGDIVDIGAYEYGSTPLIVPVTAIVVTTPSGSAVSDIHEWQRFWCQLWTEAKIINGTEITLIYDANLFVPTVAEVAANGITLTLGNASLNVLTGLTQRVITVGVSEEFTWSTDSMLLGTVAFISATETTSSVKPGVPASEIWRNAEEREWLMVNDVNVLTNVWAVPYDLNDDGRVDINDLILFIQAYGKQATDTPLAADFDNTGRVDINDLIKFIQHYGVSINSASTISIPRMSASDQMAMIAALNMIPPEFAAMFGLIVEPVSFMENVLDVQTETAFTSDATPAALPVYASTEQADVANTGSESEAKLVTVEKRDIPTLAIQSVVLAEVPATEPTAISLPLVGEIASVMPVVQVMNDIQVAIHQPHLLRQPTAVIRDMYHYYWDAYDSFSPVGAGVAMLPQTIQAAFRQQKVLEFLFSEELDEEVCVPEAEFFQPIWPGITR